MLDDFDPPIDSRDRSWVTEAACAGMPATWFFPAIGVNATAQKAVCATCPVILACREYGLDEKFGVWGGLTENERRKVRARAVLTDAHEHGTVAGHSAHLRRGTAPCRECRDAYNKYQRSKRIRSVGVAA